MKTRLLLLLLILVQNHSFAAVPDPVMPTLPNLFACNMGGAATFDLTTQNAVIFAAQSASSSNYTINYFPTQSGANDNVSPFVSPWWYNGSNGEVVWVRITRNSTGDFAVGSFTLLFSQMQIPTFAQIDNICQGSTAPALPPISTNNIFGSWSPAVINTAVVGTTTYTFTPEFFGQCAITVTMNITVTPGQGIVPAFNAIPPVCVGTNISPLPTTSNNGISGTWSPPINNEATTTYTFTPSPTTSCPLPATMTIVINNCDGIKLYPFLDYNNNGVKDTGETAFIHSQFSYELNDNGTINYGSSSSGIFYIQESNPANSYDVGFAIDPSYASVFTASNPTTYSNIQIAAGSGMNTYYFPVTYTNLYEDLAVDIVALNQPRPGFNYTNKIVYTNNSNHTMNGIVTFNHSPVVSIFSISQTGTITTTNGFAYNFSNLLPFETRVINVVLTVPTIPTVSLGQILTNTAAITPISTDISPVNNTTSEAQVIVGSYDPNDKTEAHGPQIVHATYNPNDYFNYTIRFENTGTASALNVKIDDVLNSKLDETTVRTISASHPYVFSRVNGNLTWSFNNIQLPPSVANTQIGHGYVTFKVKLKPGYAIGDIIPNTASIFFDSNPAIVTNTFQSVFVQQLAQQEFGQENMEIFPNPTTAVVHFDNSFKLYQNVAVYNSLGQQLMKSSLAPSSESLDISHLTAGIYFLEFTGNTEKQTVKIIKN